MPLVETPETDDQVGWRPVNGDHNGSTLGEFDQQLWVVAGVTDVFHPANGLAIEGGLQSVESHDWSVAGQREAVTLMDRDREPQTDWEALPNPDGTYQSLQYEPWQPGSYGKGLTLPTGGAIAWKTNYPPNEDPAFAYMGSPHHGHMWTHMFPYYPNPGQTDPRGFYLIHPSGRVWTRGNQPHELPDPQDMERFLKVHPALHFTRTPGVRRASDQDVPEVAEQDPRLTTPLVNGQMVQLRYPDTGIQQGRSEAHGAGQETQLPAGLLGEVLGTDPSTGMVSVLYVGKPWEGNQEFEPFGATGEHWRSWLLHRPDVKRPGPAYRRQR